MEQIDLAQDRDKCRGLVKTVMDLQVILGTFLTN